MKNTLYTDLQCPLCLVTLKHGEECLCGDSEVLAHLAYPLNSPRPEGVVRTQVYNAVNIERDFQDDKWGPVETHGHTIGEWIIILESEIAEAKLAIIKGGAGRNSALAEICQVAAVAVACMEQHGTTGPDGTDKWGRK